MPPRHDRRRRDKLLLGCALICTICTVATVLIVGPTVLDAHHLSAENEKRIKDVAVLTDANARLTRQIQDERTHNVIVNCRDTNHRHDATISKLNELVAATSGAERARARANLAGTIALLEAIVPHRSCRALARRQVPSNTP